MTLPPGASDPQRVSGGDINEAYKVLLEDGKEAFVKTRSDAVPGAYESEARGLEWLSQARALQVPQVLEVGDLYLVLEWVDHGRLDAEGVEELGRGLATLHRAGAPHYGDPYGASESTIGSLALPNAPMDDWPAFYAQRRLLPLLKIADERDVISEQAARAIERICGRIERLCGPPEPPARLHGDLWNGNVLADSDGRPWLIDPAVYGGHREVDLAMLRLFGAPSERVFDAYEELSPLSEGWQERVELWQLLPLLVHAVLFGGSYCEAAARIALRYGGA